MTKIVHIQYSVESGGRAALRIQRLITGNGIESHIVSLLQNVQKIDNIRYLSKFSRFFAKIDNKLQGYLTRNVNKSLGLFSYPLLGLNIAKLKEVQEADVIYIHWALNGMLNFKSIRQIAKLNKPVIFFLHDMWPITGGCHHSFTCDKYKTSSCGQCPMFNSSFEKKLSAREFKKKQNIYNRFNNLHFIAPSKWLYQCALESNLTKHKPVHYIPNILDAGFYKSVDKTVAKQILGIAKNETVIAFGAISVNSPYKGWSYLQTALAKLFEQNEIPNVSVLIFGSTYNKEIAEAIPYKTKFIGFLKDEYSTALIYNAADIFIAPSLAEAFGYVVMEALCCGTPVVGFNTGGIPDMIEHKKNGYLAEYKNADDIKEGIMYCYKNKIKGYLPDSINPVATLQKHKNLISELTK